MPLNHAKHNYEVCLFLHEETEYNDWIITTAYYSAIHFVYYKLFPGSYEDPRDGKIKPFDSFKKYCKNLKFRQNKHEATENLVEEYLPEIYYDFKTLKDNCWTARYDNYLIKDEIKNECIKGLKAISEICKDPEI